MRLAGKSAIVVGAGQTPGETVGNGGHDFGGALAGERCAGIKDLPE